MPLNLHAIHPYQRLPGNQVRMGKPNPAVRISHKDAAPIFIQGGTTFGDGGDRINRNDLPDWFWDEARKLTPKALAECGFSIDPPKRLGRPPKNEPKKKEVSDGDGPGDS